MLAKAVEDLPTGPFAFESKWDGFRAIISRNPSGAVEIRSRQGTLLNHGFPEITAPAMDLPAVILDGEIVIWHDGRLAFERLLARLNRRPASVEAEVRASPSPPPQCSAPPRVHRGLLSCQAERTAVDPALARSSVCWRPLSATICWCLACPPGG
ncbi:hypothetical protein [Streptomyces sp. NPDC127036]|uniref:ATP-dependent DNA ligase n=1 Tax=Streptomyces sp. NPDC127036 TaxID=3347112 RepID=UPI00365C7043